MQATKTPGATATKIGRMKCFSHRQTTHRLITRNSQPSGREPLMQEVQQLKCSRFLAGLAGAALLLSPGAAHAYSDINKVSEAIRANFEDQYYVTGDLTPNLFASDCVFKDPTTTVTGPEKYSAALKVLFDPAASRADLLAISAPDDHTVVLRWRLEGALRLGGLRIKPYTGTTVYTISDAGQVARHEETWDISTLDAFVSTFVPSFGAPPAPHVK